VVVEMMPVQPVVAGRVGHPSPHDPGRHRVRAVAKFDAGSTPLQQSHCDQSGPGRSDAEDVHWVGWRRRTPPPSTASTHGARRRCSLLRRVRVESESRPLLRASWAVTKCISCARSTIGPSRRSPEPPRLRRRRHRAPPHGTRSSPPGTGAPSRRRGGCSRWTGPGRRQAGSHRPAC